MQEILEFPFIVLFFMAVFVKGFGIYGYGVFTGIQIKPKFMASFEMNKCPIKTCSMQ